MITPKKTNDFSWNLSCYVKVQNPVVKPSHYFLTVFDKEKQKSVSCIYFF